MDESFTHLDMGPELGLGEQVVVSFRKNPLEIVQGMFSSKRGLAASRPAPIFDSDGQRCYNEMWTAERWEHDQVDHVGPHILQLVMLVC